MPERGQVDVRTPGHRQRRQDLSVGALRTGARPKRAVLEAVPGRLRCWWVCNEKHLVSLNTYNILDLNCWPSFDFLMLITWINLQRSIVLFDVQLEPFVIPDQEKCKICILLSFLILFFINFYLNIFFRFFYLWIF